MKLIFAVDAIFPPLTGIGRYAYELATRLPQVEHLEELRYLGMWAWAGTVGKAGMADTRAAVPNVQALMPSYGLARFRSHMAAKPWAAEVYDTVSEVWRRRLLKQGNGAVYHSPNYFLAAYDGPSVATVHDLSIHHFPETHPAARRRYFNLAFERSLRRADHLITDAESVRQELVADYGVAADRITAIPLGVASQFRPHSGNELTPALSRHGLAEGRYLLSVGTLEPRKRLEQLITAFSALPEALRSQFPLVLIGSSGWLNDRIQPLMERGRAQGWLRYLGFVPQQDLPALYAGARAFAMVSIYEGFGLPILEAMASGVPVLTSDRSSLPEVANGAALLVNPNDVAAIQVQLGRLLEDEQWRSEAVTRGLVRAGELTWSRCVQKTAAVYRLVSG